MDLEERGKEAIIIAQANVAHTTAWRKLFLASAYQTLQVFPPHKSNDKTIVSLPNEVYEEGVLQWRNFVIAQFVGKIPTSVYFKS